MDWSIRLTLERACSRLVNVPCYSVISCLLRACPLQGMGGDPFKESSSLFGQQFQVAPALLSGDPFGSGDTTEDPFKVTPKLEVDGADPFKVTPKLEVDGADPFKVTASDGKDPFASSSSSFGGTAVSSCVRVM